MPEAVFTQTIPLLLAGGGCCSVFVAELAFAALLEAAGAAAELLAEALAGAAGAEVVAGLLAGALLAAGVLLVVVSDFFVRVFLAVLVELPDSAAEDAAPAGAALLLSVAALPEAELSAASADFLELLFLAVDLLLSVPAALAELSVLAALFLDFDLDALPLSAAGEPAELSAVSVLFLLFDLVLLLPLSAVVEPAELSAASVLFLLFDLVLLLLAVESVPLCEESSVVFFFFVVFFVVVELSVWSCEPDELACRALAMTAPDKSSHVASIARTTPLLDLISAPSLWKQGLHSRSISASNSNTTRNSADHKLHKHYNPPLSSRRNALKEQQAIVLWARARVGRASGMPCGTSLADERIILKIFP